MRSIRALTTALAFAALLPSIGVAQDGREFKDAWYWGVKTGGYMYSRYAGSATAAPVAGIDWLITRNRGGLYVSYSQAFFNDTARVLTNVDAVDTIPHTVSFKNLRRLEMAAMAFPGSSVRWHPYAGLGFVLNQLATAAPVGSYATAAYYQATQQFVANARTAFSPLLLAGTQYDLRPVSVFAQATMSPTQHNFLLYNGKTVNLSYEFGLRYNVGTSIDQP